MKKLRNTFESKQAPEPVGPYPHARKVGNLLFLSGIGPRVRGSKKIPGVCPPPGVCTPPGVELDINGNILSYDIEAQCHAVFKNVRFVLEEAGSSWDQIVDITVFLTNMRDDFKKFNQIYADYFKKNQPCRTTVEVNRLPTPIAIELKCIATLSKGQKCT